MGDAGGSFGWKKMRSIAHQRGDGLICMELDFNSSSELHKREGEQSREHHLCDVDDWLYMYVVVLLCVLFCPLQFWMASRGSWMVSRRFLAFRVPDTHSVL